MFWTRESHEQEYRPAAAAGRRSGRAPGRLGLPWKRTNLIRAVSHNEGRSASAAALQAAGISDGQAECHGSRSGVGSIYADCADAGINELRARRAYATSFCAVARR